MVKKILTSMFIFIIITLTFLPMTSAETIFTDEPPADSGGLWHNVIDNRAYINMRYIYNDGNAVIETGNMNNSEYPDYDYSLYTYMAMGIESDFNFNNAGLKTQTISNPDITLYDTFKIDIVSNMMTISGPPPTVKNIVSYTETDIINEVKIDLIDWADRPTAGESYDYIYDYSYINIFADDVKVLTSRNISESVANQFGFDENPLFADMGFGVRMYWEKSSETTPIAPEEGWDELPTTTGNPENPIGDWGTVKNLSINDGNNISFNIEYNGITYPIVSFVMTGSLDFINKSNDILYYTHPDTNDKMIYFNFGDTLDSAILTATSYEDLTQWKGEALWNLTTNEVKTKNVLRVYNYIPDIDNDGNIYSYFYMPDVDIDNLISVSGMLAYRYWDDGLLGLANPEPGDINYKNVSAVRGETSSSNPTWVEDAYKSSYLASSIIGLGTVAGILPGYGWAIAGASFLIGATLNIADVNQWFAYDIEQINNVMPSVALTNDINNYISQKSDDEAFNPDTDKLYKLHLATLQGGDDVEIMGDLSNITQVVWETDGEIILLESENIDNPSWGGPGTLEPEDAQSNNEDTNLLIYIGIGIIAVILLTSSNLQKKPGLLIIIIAGIIYILYTIGLI